MDILDEEVTIDDSLMFFSILTKPTQTLERILKFYPGKYLHILIIGPAMAGTLYKNPVAVFGHGAWSILLISVCIIVLWILGWIFLYLISALLSWTGRMINGRADMDEFVMVIPWSYVPLIGLLILLIPEMIVFGDSLNHIDLKDQKQMKTVLYFIFKILELCLSVWSLVILVKGIAVVQQFIIAKAILNLILVTVVFVVFALIIFGIVFLFN